MIMIEKQSEHDSFLNLMEDRFELRATFNSKIYGIIGPAHTELE